MGIPILGNELDLRTGIVGGCSDRCGPYGDLDNKNVAFYIHNNAKMALIKSDPERRIIAILIRLFWAIMSRRNIIHGLNGPPRILTSRIDLPG